jgi:hypothetical protein
MHGSSAPLGSKSENENYTPFASEGVVLIGETTEYSSYGGVFVF